jgi:hypothetical protein
MNRLLFGDNLKWLRDRNIFPDSSVDFVYLDQRQKYCRAIVTGLECGSV